MTGARRFSLSSPDWGQAHLTPDAIVAYVDDELSPGAHERAQAHLECCGECRAEVVAQRQARAALRGAGGPSLPSSLLHSLRSIPAGRGRERCARRRCWSGRCQRRPKQPSGRRRRAAADALSAAPGP